MMRRWCVEEADFYPQPFLVFYNELKLVTLGNYVLFSSFFLKCSRIFNVSYKSLIKAVVFVVLECTQCPVAKRTVDANQLEFAKPLEYRLERCGQTVTTSFCKFVKHVVMLCMDAIIIIVVVVVVCNRPVCAINKTRCPPLLCCCVWVDTYLGRHFFLVHCRVIRMLLAVLDAYLPIEKTLPKCKISSSTQSPVVLLVPATVGAYHCRCLPLGVWDCMKRSKCIWAKPKPITRTKEEKFQNRHLGRFSTELFNCSLRNRIVVSATEL